MTSRRGLPPMADVYRVMTRLATEIGAVNLGQGVPDEEAPELLLATAADAVRAGRNSYTETLGDAGLRQAIAAAAAERGLHYDPDTEVAVTGGCLEAVTAAILATTDPGDEVVVFGPAYDSYPVIAAVAGVRLVRVELDAATGFRLDPERLRAAVTPRTRVLLVNTPHNPTGRVFDGAELTAIAEVAHAHDLVVVTDEVYEAFGYAGPPCSPATLPGMRERTVVCSSVSKTFTVSGWRVGWVLGPPRLLTSVRDVHRVLTYCAPTPLQDAVAAALRWSASAGYHDALCAAYRRRRDTLHEALTGAGLDAVLPEGGHFVTVRLPAGVDDTAFCMDLAHQAGVVGLPMSSFQEEAAAPLARFAFCKSDDVVARAAARLAGAAVPSVDRYVATH